MAGTQDGRAMAADSSGFALISDIGLLYRRKGRERRNELNLRTFYHG